jgi:thymidylate synthase
MSPLEPSEDRKRMDIIYEKGGVFITPSLRRAKVAKHSQNDTATKSTQLRVYFPVSPSSSTSSSPSSPPASSFGAYSNECDGDQLGPTQEPSYTQDCSAGTSGKVAKRYGSLEDVTSKNITCIDGPVFVIGRDTACDLTVWHNSCVSRKHCILDFDGYGTCTFMAKKLCWVLNRLNQKWEALEADKMLTLCSGQHFRLLPPGNSPQATQAGTEFRIDITCDPIEQTLPKPGSYSFDVQYLTLLRAIESEGEVQNNKKGPNKTLRRSFHFVIDLSHEDPEKNLLPLSTLRGLYGGRGAIVEAMFYLRGEDNIKFLQDNKCHFWDKQSESGGFVGLNYGLLTNFPQTDGSSVNQLEQEVLRRLCSGDTSRNMICSLIKPGERTVQVACTSSIQFSVSVDEYKNESLDLTVNQRSSDVIVGLPHDVVVWSIILHLVRREVKLRTNGKRCLAAGNLVFAIAQGGAHVYSANADTANILLHREPMKETQPYLAINNSRETSCLGMLDLARDFQPQKFLVKEYTKYHLAIKVHQCV